MKDVCYSVTTILSICIQTLYIFGVPKMLQNLINYCMFSDTYYLLCKYQVVCFSTGVQMHAAIVIN